MTPGSIFLGLIEYAGTFVGVVDELAEEFRKFDANVAGELVERRQGTG